MSTRNTLDFGCLISCKDIAFLGQIVTGYLLKALDPGSQKEGHGLL